MAAAEILVAVDALGIGVLGLVVLVQVLVAVGADFEMNFLDTVGGQMAHRAVVLRYRKFFPVHVDKMQIFVEAARAVAAVVVTHDAAFDAVHF